MQHAYFIFKVTFVFHPNAGKYKSVGKLTKLMVVATSIELQIIVFFLRGGGGGGRGEDIILSSALKGGIN